MSLTGPAGPTPGTRLGPYEVLEALGSGGMGEVYRGRDTRLGREVAIKVLPRSAAHDSDRLRRFDLESRAAGALSHPNVLTVFDTGLHEGRPFIVFELLRGQTFRDAFQSGPLPARRAIEIAVQVADGLAAAHEAGIIHRDLKPENLFVTTDGRVKILDFGLAKLRPKADDVVDGEVATSTATEAGAVLGTVGYMSPEQVKGRPADARSDIFAFGAVLYEMLSGRRAFCRDSAVETMQAILKEDPPEMTDTGAAIPAALQRIVLRCLEKNPEQRFQSARDLAFALETLSGIAGPASAGTAPHRAGAHRWLVAAIAALLIAIAAIGLRVWPSRTPSGARTVRLEKLTNRGNVLWSAVISPDGHYLAYLAPNGRIQTLWLRDLVDRTETRLVPALDGAEIVQFAPDGRAVYYSQQRATAEAQQLYRVPLIGGEPRLVRDGGAAYGLSPDGARLGYLDSRNSFVVGDLEGGQPRTVEGAYAPGWSADGRQLLFARDREGKSALYVASADGTQERRIADLSQRPDRIAWRPHDQTTACLLTKAHLFLVDLRNGVIRPFGEPVGGKNLEVDHVEWIPDGTGLVAWRRDSSSTSQDRRPWLVSYPEGQIAPIVADAHQYSRPSMTSDGSKLAIIQSMVRSDVIVSSPEGSVRQKIESGTDVRYRARWTADGRIVYSSNEAGSYDLYLCDADGSNRRALTFDRASDEIEPAASPDGRYIVFVLDRTGRQELVRINPDGTGLKRLTEANASKLWERDRDPVVTPDGRFVLYRHWDNGPSLWKVPIEGGTPVLVRGTRPATSNEVVYGASASPDGRSLAFLYFTMDPLKGTSPTDIAISDLDGRILKRFPLIEKTLGVHDDWRVQWSHDGRSLYYTLPTRDSSDLWRQSLAGGPAVQVTHFDEPIQYFDWSLDGKAVVFSRGFTVSDVVLVTDFH